MSYILLIGDILRALPKLIELIMLLLKVNKEKQAQKERDKAKDEWDEGMDRFKEGRGK